MSRFGFCGWVLGVLLVALWGFDSYYSTGIVHATKKAGRLYYGCICHGDTASQSVHVRISGADSLAPGQIGAYTLSVIRDSNIAAGFNVASFRGLLSVGDSIGEQWMEDELTHTTEKLANGNDTISWMFYYEAPEFSVFDTLYSTGNSVDLSFDPDGDFWNFGDNFVIRVGNPTAVAGRFEPLPTYKLSQNYPNPFNPGTTIRFYVPSAQFVTLRVFNILGQEISTLVNGFIEAGNHAVYFDAGKLGGGIYVYRIETANLVETKKMALVK